MVSVAGLNCSEPAKAKAATSSGEVTKEWVVGLPSCLPTKLRLYEEMTEFGVPWASNVSRYFGSFDCWSVYLCDFLPIPLPNARSARVTENGSARRLELIQDTFAFHSSSDLFASGGDEHRHLRLQARITSFAEERGGLAEILERSVRAAADHSMRDLLWPRGVLNISSKRGQGMRKIWGKRSVDMRLQRAKVDFDDFVVMLFAAGVGLEEVQVCLCCCGDVASVGCGEVAAHRIGVREYTGCRADLC
jgi:hypothetical protein